MEVHSSNSAGILYTFSQIRPNLYGGTSTITVTKLMPSSSNIAPALEPKRSISIPVRPKQTLNYGNNFLVPHQTQQSQSCNLLTICFFTEY
jgi:hypothetical protein